MRPSRALHRGFLDTDEGQLHYRRQGEGPPVVLMMTLPFSTAMFLPLMAALSDTHDVLAVDLMGQGLSDRRTRAWSVEEHARAVWQGLDGLKLGPLTLLGGHFTAQVAVEAAIMQPERLTHLFLDGVVGWSLEQGSEYAKAWASSPFWMSSTFVADRWEYVWALMRRLDPELEMQPSNVEIVAELAEAFMFSRLGDPAGQGMFDYDMRARLPLLTTPTTLIGSPTDTLRGFHETALAAIPNGTQHLFETVNPLYQLDRPERAAEYAAMMRGMMAGA